MIICRRFVHLSSTKLENAKHSFELLDRLAKSAASSNNDNFNESIQKVSDSSHLDPLNTVLARWKNEFLKAPGNTLNPRKVLEKIDKWKGLVDSISVTNSLKRNIQEHLEELLRPDVKSYMHIIQAVGSSIDEHSHQRTEEKMNKVYFIDALLKRLIEESKTDISIQPNVSSFSTVMNAWAKTNSHSNNTNNAKHERRGISSSSKKVEELLLCMDKLNTKGWPNLQPNVVIYNILLNAYAKEGKVRKIEDILQRMIRLKIPGVSPDSISYSTLLSAYAKSGTHVEAKKAESLLHQMLELYNHGMENAKPNVISFSNVMQCYSQLGNGEKAEEWLRRLKDLYHCHQDPDWEPDLGIYNTVVQAWVLSGQPAKAEQFLRQMMVIDNENIRNDRISENDPTHFVEPNCQTFNIVLSAWAKIGEAERAEAILMEMHKLHVENAFDTRPTVVTYNTVLDSYAQKTNRVINANRKNFNSKNKKIKKVDRINQGEDAPWNRAEAILNHMIDLSREGDLSVKPTARTWNTVINVCAKAGKINKAEKILEQFISFSTPSETGIRETVDDATPSVRTWNTLLSGCVMKGDVRKAKYFWLRMKSNGIEPDIVSYNTLLNCHVHSSKRKTTAKKISLQEAVESIFRRLRHDPNVTPNHITYLAVVNFWTNQGIPERAELFILNMARASQQSAQNEDLNARHNNVPAPSRSLFHYVLTSWGEHGKPKIAEELLLKMAELSDDHGFDVRPTTETYNRLLNCWAKSMKLESGERAEVILREMEELVKLGDDEATPDICSYNSVLNAWSNSSDAAALTRIDNLILEMLLKGNINLLPDSFSYGTWLKAIASCDEMEKKQRVEEVIKTMNIHNFRPNEYIRQKIQNLSMTKKKI